MSAVTGGRYRAVVEYDGTDLLGFQRQAVGRTVQGELETALARIGWQGRAVLGAGRRRRQRSARQRPGGRL